MTHSWIKYGSYWLIKKIGLELINEQNYHPVINDLYRLKTNVTFFIVIS